MLCLGEVVLLDEGGLRLGKLRVSCRRCFLAVLYIMQAGFWGGAPHVKGTMSWFCKFVGPGK